MAYRDIVLTDSPVDYYEMNTGTGTDSGTGNRTLTLSGGVTTGVAGMFGNGWTFDGVNDSASMGTWPTLTNAFTFEAWVKPNLAGVNDTPTVIRRDGTDIHLLRVRGSALGVNPGQAEVYADGLTLVSGAYRVDDGNWHHIVYTQSGNTAKLYVDGVERASGTTSQSSFNMGTGAGYIGSANGTGEFYKGTMDEVAIYNTALSATRIAAHFAAGSGSATIDETTGTLSLQVPAATFSTGTTIDLDTPTVDVDVEYANVEAYGNNTQTVTVGPTADEERKVGTGGLVSAAANNIPIEGGTGATRSFARLQFSKSAMFGGANVSVSQAVLNVVVYSRNTAPVFVITPTGQSSSALTPYPAPAGGSTLSFDVTQIVNNAVGDAVTIDLVGTGGSVSNYVNIHSNESPTPAYRPKMTVLYEQVPVSVAVDVSTQTMSLAAIAASVETQGAIDIALETVATILAANDVTVDSGIQQTMTTATTSVVANDVVVESTSNPDAYIDVSTLNVIVQSTGAVVGIGTVVDADNTDTVLFGAYDTTIDTTQGVAIDLDTPRIDTRIVRLTDVNGEPVLPVETDDPYFVATMRTLDGIAFGYSGGLSGTDKDTVITADRQTWLRLNERSGTVAVDRLSGNGTAPYNYNLNGVVIGLNEGPEGRHNVHFNGDAYATAEDRYDRYFDNSALEFTFRTTKKTQFLFGNADVTGGLSDMPTPTWELWMVDGRLEVRTWKGYTDRNGVYRTNAVKNTAFTDLADGEWHHIVVQNGHATNLVNGGYKTDTNFAWGLEIYADGDLELRRRYPTVGVTGAPDYIGGRPNNYYEISPGSGAVFTEDLPRTQWFVGDLTEVVYRNGRTLTSDEVAIQRDAMFGINAVRPEPARLTLTAKDASVRGNKPRVLVLDFQRPYDNPPKDNWTAWTLESQALAIQGSSEFIDFSPFTANGRVELLFPGYGERLNNFNFPNKEDWPDVLAQRFFYNVLRDQNGDLRLDPVTDNYRLIDLETDLNMDEFDVISIVGYPANDTMWQDYEYLEARSIEPKTPMRNQLENLMGQIKEQVIVHRKSLYVTDPFSATALGIIDQVDVVPEAQERAYAYDDQRIGAVNPGFDTRAYVTDPFKKFFGGEDDDTNRLTKSDYQRSARYTDTHAIHRQRVRTPIAGLTTIPSWITTDEIHWWNVNPFNEPPWNISRRFEQRPFGLNVGDEFYLDIPAFTEQIASVFLGPFKQTGFRAAAPVSAIKVGSAVTTFSLFHWVVGVEELAKTAGNPYYNHAVSIAVQPGDEWDGQVVSGKVYVNFTEGSVFMPEHQRYETIPKWIDRPFEKSAEERNSTMWVGKVIRLRDGMEVTITPQMARYQDSTAYGAFAGTEIALPRGSKPDWGWSAGGVRGSGLSGGAAHALDWRWAWNGQKETIYVPTMSNRAFMWLTKDLDIAGEVNAIVGTVEVTTEAHDVEVEVTSNAVVDLSTARVTVESYTDADTINPDVTVLAPTVSVTLKPSGMSTDVDVDTPSVRLNGSEVLYEAALIDWSEAIVLTMPRQITTLILEDN